jgi:serine/threonine-protein kinase
MADVFLAVAEGPAGSGFSKLGVVKRLRENLADDPEFVSMLVDEARIAARLNHPNVVQTNEVGEVGAQYFIAMEYLDGQPLHRIQYRSAQRLKSGQPPLLTKEQQQLIIAETLAGLHHAHELCDYDGTPLHIVHRDITPHNVFVTYDGQVKVVDFGIAKAVGRASETRQGVVKGKVRYMAPEQAVGKPVDRRADIFSAGIMLWEAVTGQRMWKDRDDLQIVQSLVSGDLPPSPRAVDPTVHETIDRICRKALASRPEDRYATAEEFRVDLEQHLAETGALLEARRKLGSVVIELFTDKRAEIRQVIETQIAALAEATSMQASGQFETIAIPVDTHSSPTPISHALEDQSTSVTNQKTALYAPKTKPSRARWIGLAAASAAAIVALAFVAVSWRTAGPSARSATSAIDQPAKEVTVHLTGSPANARVSIDDGPFQSLPFEGKFPRDTRDHTVTVKADGFVTKSDPISLAKDVDLSINLAAAAPAQAQGQPAAKPTAAPVYNVVTVVKPAASAKADSHAAPVPTPSPPTPDPRPGRKSADPLDKGDPWANK